MKMFNYLLFVFAIIFVICQVKSAAVCDLNTLIVEIRQDLADNGMLDCLRVIEPPHFVEETEEQKNLRLAAQWDTSCAFEASSNWFEVLKKNYGISNLVDSTGEPVKTDFEDQADMCEIIRASVAQNLFNIPDLDMQKIPTDIIDKIDCAGVSEEKVGPRICAATSGSYFQQDSWTIFLDTGAIKLGGKPEFNLSEDQPEPLENPFNNPAAQSNLIKDLMKFTPDQLDLKQGELANMIDRAQEEEPNPNKPEKENQNEKSKDVHVHVKRLKEASFVASKQFSQVDGASTSFKMNESRIVFGFYMASIKFENPSNAFFKLSYANRELPESRQAIGSTKLATLTGAFGEVYQPKSGGEEINLEVLYDVTGEGNVSTDSGEQNFSFGAITLPEGAVFKKINSAQMDFHKSEVWNPIPHFDLTINFQEKSPAYFFIMYNLAFPIPGNFILETRLKLGASSIPESAVQCGPTNVIGSHSGVVLQIKPGSTNLALEYKYNGDSVSLQDFTDSHYVQSITAFQLPQSAEVKGFKLEKPFVLNTNGEWKGFELEAAIELTKRKTVLILYNINLKVGNANFTSRLRVDTRYNKKSVFTVNGQSFANAQGYVVMILKPGKYNFDMDFKSDAQNTFDPSNSELDGQIVSLQLVLLD